MKRWILGAASFAVLSFFAQFAAAQQVTPSDGLQVPDASIATVGDALALELNPGGLAFISRPELGYGFQLASERLRGVAPEAQSYFLAAGTGWLGAGVAAQWLQKPDLGGELQSYRKFTVGTGAAAGGFGLGMALNFLGSSDNERLDGLVGIDFGMQLRASKLLGAGVMIRDANGPFYRDNRALPTRIEGSIALRFWDGRLALEQSAQTNLKDRYVLFTPRLSVEPVRGLRLFGRSEFLLSRVGDVFDWSWAALFTGLELSLGSIGAAYAATTHQYDPTDHQQFSGISSYHWISPGKRPPVVPATKRWIFVNLNQPISEKPKSGFFSGRSRSFMSIAEELRRIADSKSVEGVVFGATSGLGYAQTWEVRELIAQIRGAGKKTVSVLHGSDLRAFYLASAAEKIWYVPTSALGPMGLRSNFISVREAFAKLGVEAQFIRIGHYKSTPEMFVVDQPTEANQEQRNGYMDGYWSQIVGALASSRGMSTAEMEKLLGEVHLPDDAVKNKLVDRVVYPDEVDQILRKEFSATLEAGFPEPNYVDDAWDGGPRVALVVVNGNIVQGSSGDSPFLGGASSGAKSVVATLERLRMDSTVRAVVVRVDSPGGSAVASDLIYRSLRKLAAQKPVVASMGNMATSGGYYVAAGASEIFAAPTTMTGSIGIFAGKVNIEELGGRLGLNVESMERGTPSSYSDIHKPWTEEEIAQVGKGLNYMYRLFLTQVAQTRPLSIEEIDKVARGHVWLGGEAEKAKLVDKTGGLLAALSRAEELAGLKPGAAEFVHYDSKSRSFSAGLQVRAAKWLGLDAAGAADSMLQPKSMLTAFVKQAAFAWQIPLLYENGEALMLPMTAAVE